MSSLETCVQQWLAAAPGKLELSVAKKDFQGLFDLAPINPRNLEVVSGQEVPQLKGLVQIVRILRDALRRSLSHLSTRQVLRNLMVSPYMGGVDPDSCERALRKHVYSSITIATLNPGRTGLSQLGTQEVLWWRLLHIGSFLVQHDVQLCVLPGARFPAGAELPEGFPYMWIGAQTTSWSGVGLLVSVELQFQVDVVESLGSDSVLWITLHSLDGPNQDPKLILGAVSGPPGGNVDFWRQFAEELASLQKQFPASRFIVAADCNVHLSYLVSHPSSCRYLHCKQSAVDNHIQRIFQRHGLEACNPQVATHVSGTSIDLIMSHFTQPVPVEVLEEDVGFSDHRMVLGKVPLAVQFSFENTIGRVLWAHGDAWDTVIALWTPCLETCTLARQQATRYVIQLPTLSIKRKKAVLDAAAWVRDVVVCILGHCQGLIEIRRGEQDHKTVWYRVPKPENFPDYDDYKAAVAKFNLDLRNKSLAKYLRLKATQPAAASQFLSSWFKKSKQFQTALTSEEAGQLLNARHAVNVVTSDLLKRADNDFDQDPGCAHFFANAVKEIKAAGAPATGLGQMSFPLVNTACNCSLYTMDELNKVLNGVKPKKSAVHCPLAAVRPKNLPSRAMHLV